MTQYRKHNTYGKLNAVVLGSYYFPEYFDCIDNPDVREPLKQIAQEINEDLDYFEKVLKDHGSVVLRPQLVDIDYFVDFYHQHRSFLPPPLQPRNNYSVINDTLYQFSKDSTSIHDCLLSYNKNIVDLTESNKNFFNQTLNQNLQSFNDKTNTWFRKQKYQELAGVDWPTFEDYVNGDRSSIVAIQEELKYFESSLCYESKEITELQGPNIFPIDEALIVDCKEYNDYTPWIRENIKYNKPVQVINTGAGHTDGCFTILGNRTIIGISPLIDYKQCFPEYHLIPISHNDYMAHVERSWISGTGGQWWIPGRELTPSLIDFVQTYMKLWTGHAYESAFDVNTFSLNSDTVCVISSHNDLSSQLKSRKINSIIVPWRHRFFVDCGLHCITLDLNRN